MCHNSNEIITLKECVSNHATKSYISVKELPAIKVLCVQLQLYFNWEPRHETFIWIPTARIGDLIIHANNKPYITHAILILNQM